jgi:hypothetical protein
MNIHAEDKASKKTEKITITNDKLAEIGGASSGISGKLAKILVCVD